MERLKENGRATVEDLAGFLYVSPATVRRDLSAMQKLGMLKRTHGGAIHVDNGEEVSIFVRMESDSEEKEEAATIAAKHIPEFNTVFIDNSSTCFALADKIDFTYKTVVTNGIQLAQKLGNKKNVEVILLGGSLRYKSNATNGAFARSMLEQFRFDLMLLGAAAIREDGSYESSLDTVEIKKTAFERSDKHILIVGKRKFDLKALYRVAPLPNFDLICTNARDPFIKEWASKGIKIVNQ
ncbi:MAG: DeoR/GlpR family DNA-binding transcription regulator [Bacilli bacterium]|nr:DeoR/GlpR family DNA-binding transcription regulator [Bacilli bacterium]